MQTAQTRSRSHVAIPRLRQPIVFLHGLLGYSRIRVAGWTFASYFANIPTFNSGKNSSAIVPQVQPIALLFWSTV